MPLKSAIYQGHSIWHDTKYAVLKTLSNGLVVGQVDEQYIAISQMHLMKGQISLRPVVGQWSPKGERWALGTTGNISTLQTWMTCLRIPRLRLEALLRAHVEPLQYIKISVVAWSLEDLHTLSKGGYFVGFSAPSCWWRIYGLIPREVWEESRPAFDGKVNILKRFGAIATLGELR